MEFVIRITKNLRKCPHCGSIRLAEIEYGLPAFTDQLKEDLKAERVVLGGCCVDDPKWKCLECRVRINEDGTYKDKPNYEMGGFDI